MCHVAIRLDEVTSVACGQNWLRMGAAMMRIILNHRISGYITRELVSRVDCL